MSARFDVVDAECILCDIDNDLRLPLLKRAGSIYSWLSSRRFPLWLYDLLWVASEHETPHRIVERSVSRLTSRRIMNVLTTTSPDVVVVVHPLYLSRAFADARRRLNSSCEIVTVVTDPVSPHRAWVCAETDALVCASLSAARRLERFVPGRAISVLGLPINPSRPESRASIADVRSALSLNEAQFTVLLMGGGCGTGDMHAYALHLASCENAQLVVLTGANEELAERMRCDPLLKSAIVLGWVDNVEDYMYAADVVVSKPGPSTIHEVAAVGRPLVLTPAVGRQELGNAVYAVDQQWAMVAGSPSEAESVIRKLRATQPLWPDSVVASDQGEAVITLVAATLACSRGERISEPRELSTSRGVPLSVWLSRI
jgi:1,2-diacylglycerol 3-beta-galactosyltransferase